MKQYKRLNKQRRRRQNRVRNRVKRDSIRPRLCVIRSNKHIYAQVIDDAAGRTLVAVGTCDKNLRGTLPSSGNKTAAAAVGKLVAERSLQQGIETVAFDRREYKYHGRVAALADAARAAGLKF